jgi:hypothetical protein
MCNGVAQRICEQQRLRDALPNDNAFLLHLGDGKRQQHFLCHRQLHALSFAVRQRYALCKLHALRFTVQQRNSERMCNGIAQRLCEQQSQRDALSNDNAFLLHLGDGKRQQHFLRHRQLHALSFAVRQCYALCKLHALRFTVQQRNGERMCNGVAQRICEQQSQRDALPNDNAFLLHLGDGKR